MEQEVTTQETPASEPHHMKDSSDFEHNIEGERDEEGYSPMFDDEVVSDETDEEAAKPEADTEEAAAPSGEDDPATHPPKDEADKEKKADEEEKPESDEAKPEDKEAKPEDDAEKDKAEKDAKEEKPPEGYVKQEALWEERTKRQKLSRQMQELQQQLETLQSKPQQPEQEKLDTSDKEFEDFKILSDQEVRELAEDDIYAAHEYQNKLYRYHEHQRNKAAQEYQERQRQEREKQVVEEAVSEMEKIPGLYDPESNVARELTDFAVNHGVDAETLSALTDPRTKLTVPGGKEATTLGKGAAKLVSLIHNLHGELQSRDPEKMRTEIEQELRSQIEEEVTAKLTEKFKTSPPSARSLGDAPSVSSEPTREPLTEDEWASKSEEERRQLLGG